MSNITLRDYQQKAVKSVKKAYKDGIYRQLIVMPTGSGKTVVMAAIAKQQRKRVLVLAHRKELIQQTYDQFKIYWPESDVGIYAADRKELGHTVIIGSIQSCSTPKSLKKLQRKKFNLMIIDECHHSEAKSYQRVIESLGFKTGSKLLIGVTATPHRADKKSLNNTFDKLVFTRSIGFMIRRNYLCPVYGRKLFTSTSLDNVGSRSGDFITKQLASAVNIESRNQFIVNKYKQYASDRKAIAFCVNIQHCRDLAKTFNNNGIKSAAVWGTMPLEKRKKILHDLHIGTIKVVTSCEILTEGYDEETISSIIMARPTKSKSLFIQMVGRGLRKSPEKENCIVLDFTDTGNNLNNIISLSKAIPEAQQLEEPSTKNVEKKRTRNFNVEERKDTDKEFDLLGLVTFAWIQISEEELQLMDDQGNEIIISQKNNGYIANLFFKNETQQPLVLESLSFFHCIKICEDFAREFLEMKFADINATWMKKHQPPTKGQIQFLQNKEYKTIPTSKAEASIAIRTIIAFENKKKRMERVMCEQL